MLCRKDAAWVHLGHGSYTTFTARDPLLAYLLSPLLSPSRALSLSLSLSLSCSCATVSLARTHARTPLLARSLLLALIDSLAYAQNAAPTCAVEDRADQVVDDVDSMAAHIHDEAAARVPWPAIRS